MASFAEQGREEGQEAGWGCEGYGLWNGPGRPVLEGNKGQAWHRLK